MKSPVSPTPMYSSTPRINQPISPLPLPATHSDGCLSAAAKRYRYLRRVLHFHQMDFEFALWQMLYLFIAPQKVYRDFQYRKQTKAQFARDDPAFLVLLCGWIFVSSVCFAVVLRLSVGRALLFTLYMFFIDTLMVACIVTTVLWYVSNRWLRSPSAVIQGQDVEWSFSFDVHLNAFFPSLVMLHIVQILLYHVVLSGDGWFSHLLGNCIWMVSFGYYFYITFLGYSALPILSRTRVFLYPLVMLVPVFLTITLCRLNLSTLLMNFYKYRVMN